MEQILAWFEIVGIVAASLSGSMQAIAKKVDLFGVLLLGMTTALGGGILRDMTIGNLPPRNFQNYHLLIISASVSLATFLVARLTQEHYRREEALISRINNVFDALGVGSFAVSGAAVAYGLTDNGVLIVYAGMITAIGGGIIRDVLLREIPFVLKKRIYAAAALLGALVYYWLLLLGLPDAASACVGVAVVFVLRMLATIFHWNFPKAID
ncbi:MAG: trimeric intracellular cation channel family protein [Clostridia bacterium]|nr:trimeric intracellular cation channel family protein [Clostridia bacterium]